MPRALSRPQQWAAALDKANNAIASAREANDLLAEALGDLDDIRSTYEDWRDNLPENLQGSALAEKLDAVCDLSFDATDDLETIESAIADAEVIELPQGFGRD